LREEVTVLSVLWYLPTFLKTINHKDNMLTLDLYVEVYIATVKRRYDQKMLTANGKVTTTMLLDHKPQ